MRLMTKTGLMLLLVLALLPACGKKTSLIAPEDALPRISNASVALREGFVYVTGTFDRGIASVHVERYVRPADASGMPVRTQIATIEDRPFKFVDRDVKGGMVYQYTLTPYMKDGSVGNPWTSSPVSYAAIVAPVIDLSAKVNENRGAVKLNWDGACDEFAIYRYPDGKEPPFDPYAVTQKKLYSDEYPIPGSPMKYEIRCRIRNFESAGNPSATVTFPQ